MNMMKTQLINVARCIAQIGKRQKVVRMVTSSVPLLLCLAVSLSLHVLPAWATERQLGPRVVIHTFSFGGGTENPGIKILNFQYGDSKTTGTYVEPDWLATGHVGQGGGVTGGMPVGDFLYVKWSILATGKVLEDRVDLKSRLPAEMTNKIIHFTITDQQLNVYVIEGNTEAYMHASGSPDCAASSYGPFRCTRIYPDHWANF